MKKVKTGERQSSHHCAAPHQHSQVVPNDGYLSNDVRADRAGGIPTLIPRQEVPGESHPQDKKRKRAASNPQELAFTFVGPIEECLQKVQQQNYEHGG